jgi:triosephosphate isomerase
VLLKQGTVIRKWSHNNLPVIDEEQMSTPLEKLEEGQMPIDSVPVKLMWLLMWFVMPLVLLTIADRMWMWSKWIRKKVKLKKMSILATQEKAKENNQHS